MATNVEAEVSKEIKKELEGDANITPYVVEVHTADVRNVNEGI